MEFDTGMAEYFVPSFDSVSTTGKITLGQITPVGEWDPTVDHIATIDETGCEKSDESFVYFEGDWYFYDGEAPVFDSGVQNDYQLDANHGLIVSVTDSSTTLQFSGAVQKGEAEMYFDYESGMATYTGNFTAAPMTLGSMVPSDDWDPTVDHIATIDDTGCEIADESFTYFDGNWYYYDGEAPDFDRGEQNSYSFPANKGLILVITAGATVNVAMPLAE